LTRAPRLVLVGRVVGVFGVRGDLRIAAFTAEVGALLTYRDLKRADGAPALTLVSGRPDKGGLVAHASGVDTRDQAEALKGLELYIEREALPAPDEDEFYLADLIGLEARGPAGGVIGRVKAVENFGAGDLLEIAPADGGASWWQPFTREATPQVRIDEGWIEVVRPTEAGEDER
jgi:16S rRNA processing protein RimM